jgi:glycosyltransferase involved in cell wall biosynthesis
MVSPARHPTVSIVVSTYNRSNVLALAIESARGQTVEDWEMVVVGDACTDDTAEVVASFHDARIRYVNLAENWGEQSKPNNEGVARSHGDYVAFLNHDDLWFPDHLERALAVLGCGEAGMVFAVVGLVGGDGSIDLRPSWSGRYEPVRVVAPASGWVARRETIEQVGPWRSYRDSFLAPSQDWIRRAHGAGVRIEQVPAMTVLAVQSGFRPGSYARRENGEQQELLRRMREPGFREAILSEVALRSSAELLRPRSLGENLERAAGDVARRGLGGRLAPLRAITRYRRRGGLIDELRRVRGLPAK